MNTPCADGSFFIDRDGLRFRHVLNFLRNDTLFVADDDEQLAREILEEASFFNIDALTTLMQTTVLPRILRHRGARDTTRAQIVHLLSQQVATTDHVAVNTTYSSSDGGDGARRKRRRGSSTGVANEANSTTPDAVNRHARMTARAGNTAGLTPRGNTTPIFTLNEDF
jgi:hypothetical protein